MNVHDLEGCSPVPLGSYLKAMAVLRLVSEQADPDARGWWEGERFRLASKLTREELIDFFSEKYVPASALSPWGKGSGFFDAGDSVLSMVERSAASRFGRLREGIKQSRELQFLAQLAAADDAVRFIKEESKQKGLTGPERASIRSDPTYKARLAEAERQFKSLKQDLIGQLRLQWRGPQRDWLDASVVSEDGATERFPALLGTGGNDGRLDFSKNYLQRLTELFDIETTDGRPRHGTREAIVNALFAGPARALAKVAAGQFAPGNAGGANAGECADAHPQLNRFDFVLAIEGAILFKAAATRRMETGMPARAVAPFAVGSQAAGYASSAVSDETSRGEQWLPLWSQPATLGEVRHLLAEGRSQIGARKASEPQDFARAAARLGTARGVAAFCRYAFIERNGQSKLAVPLSRIDVASHVMPNLANIDDLELWLRALNRQARGKNAPATLVSVERRLADAIFAALGRPDLSERWMTLLLRMTDVESVQVTGAGYLAGPIPNLRPEWVLAADDGSPEFRLALAFALQRGASGDRIRRHWLTLERGRFAVSGTGSEARLRPRADRVMTGRSGIDDAIEVLTRRLVESAQSGARQLDLHPARNAAASARDLAAVLGGDVDVNRTLHLARALMAVDLRAWQATTIVSMGSGPASMPEDAWLVFRLAMLGVPLPDGRHPRMNPAILQRLAAGDVSSAFELARRSLRAAGISISLRTATATPATARLWAAALAFPIARTTAVRFAKHLDSVSSESKEKSA